LVASRGYETTTGYSEPRYLVALGDERLSRIRKEVVMVEEFNALKVLSLYAKFGAEKGCNDEILENIVVSIMALADSNEKFEDYLISGIKARVQSNVRFGKKFWGLLEELSRLPWVEEWASRYPFGKSGLNIFRKIASKIREEIG